MNIIYIPLDDRPCNVYYPQWIARLQPHLCLTVPPLALLGQKKKPAPLDRLWSWLEEGLERTPKTIGIFSMEQLIYGGLLPSRVHQQSLAELIDRVQGIRNLKHRYPQLKIYASNLIMRCPTYDSAEEEPDYYEQWGAALFRWGWLYDRQNRSLLTDPEAQEWSDLQNQIPSAILKDYSDRRRLNLQVNLAIIELVKQGVIHFLSMPQDDAAIAGFTAMDQRVIATQIQHQNLSDRIHIYPGADEVGCTLLSRAFVESELQSSPQVYPLYATPIAKTLIPLYEDRPLGKTVQAHLKAAGADLISNPQEAAIILALNTPASIMQESWQQSHKDLSYDTQRNLDEFMARIQQGLNQGQPVALADIAFANGGETDCIQKLDRAQLLDRLLAYGGWNTCGNTLGTVISTAILAWRSAHPEAIVFNLINRLLEDWLYQALVRQDLIEQYLPRIGASYYNFAGEDQSIAEETARRLGQAWQQYCQHSFRNVAIETIAITHPWRRMFEIFMDVRIRFQEDFRKKTAATPLHSSGPRSSALQ